MAATAPARRRPTNRPTFGGKSEKASAVSKRFAGNKYELARAGSQITALTYQRASSDDTGQEKSVGEQEEINAQRVADFNWTLGDSFTDNDKSGYRKGVVRKEFAQLQDAIEGGAGDVLVVWELSRSQRDLAVYVQIRDMCIRVGLWFWMVGQTIYDLRDHNDRSALNFMAITSEGLSSGISAAVTRGIQGSAERGNPHGIVAFGYVRTYDSRRRFASQIPDTEEHELPDGTTWNAADIVRWLFAEALACVPLTNLARTLNGRGIPTPRQYAAMQGTTKKGANHWVNSRWHSQTIRRILLNEQYIGSRVHHNEVLVSDAWETLVDLELFQALEEFFLDEGRITTQPGRAKYLLSCIVYCYKCGDECIYLGDQDKNPKSSRKTPGYRCRHGHTSVRASELEMWVTAQTLTWLTDGKRWDDLKAAEAVAGSEYQTARQQIIKLQDEVDTLMTSADDPEADDLAIELAARRIRAKKIRIKELEGVALPANLSREMRMFAGTSLQEASQIWASLSLDGKRSVIRQVFGRDIYVIPAGRGNNNAPIEDRATFLRPPQFAVSGLARFKGVSEAQK